MSKLTYYMPSEKAIDAAIDACNYADYFKLHNLMKNPNDLPKMTSFGESDGVFVLIGNKNWMHWEVACYSYVTHRWKYLSGAYEPIAWKYIDDVEGLCSKE